MTGVKGKSGRRPEPKPEHVDIPKGAPAKPTHIREDEIASRYWDEAVKFLRNCNPPMLWKLQKHHLEMYASLWSAYHATGDQDSKLRISCRLIQLADKLYLDPAKTKELAKAMAEKKAMTDDEEDLDAFLKVKRA